MKRCLYVTSVLLSIPMALSFVPHATGAEPTPTPYRAFLPYVVQLPDPAAPKQIPEPYNIEAVDAVFHDEDLPGFVFDPQRSGPREIPPWMRRLGAVDAHFVWYWNCDVQSRPKTVYNTVIIFLRPAGAAAYVQHAVQRCEDTGGVVVPSPVVGDEMIVCATDVGHGVVHNATFRYGNVVSGVGIDASLDTTVDFARLSLARIEQAIRDLEVQ